MPVKLPAAIHTRDQLELAIIEIRDHADVARRQRVRQRLSLSSSAGMEWSPGLADLVAAAAKDGEPTPEELEELATDLEALKNLPVVHITLAAFPGEAVRQRLVQWFRDSVSENLLVEFRANRTIIGGAVIRTPSHVYNYSYRSILLENRDIIPKLLRKQADEVPVNSGGGSGD